MRGALDIDLIFPVMDPASAKLMWAKAECLHRAGVIDARVKLLVHAQCLAVLARSESRGDRLRSSRLAPYRINRPDAEVAPDATVTTA